jgi:hypothetical protein
MPALARFLLPMATAVAATLYLAAAVPHQLDLALAATPAQSPEQAELARCVADGRDADACLDEADGKALVERAEWLARADDAARRGSRP